MRSQSCVSRPPATRTSAQRCKLKTVKNDIQIQNFSQQRAFSKSTTSNYCDMSTRPTPLHHNGHHYFHTRATGWCSAPVSLLMAEVPM